MSPSLRNSLLCCVAAACPIFASGQEGFLRSGGEYSIPGSLAGIQAKPQLSINSAGGFMVWEDNVADGRGLGIRAQALDNNLAKVGPAFRVNQIAPGDQENARVALLQNGGAVFVWQGGRQGFQHIYARFLSSSNTWFAGDIAVSSFPRNFQALPAVAVLDNGNVVVVWGSFNQSSPNSMQDIYGQILSPAGDKVGGEFQVNQFTPYNQRSPAVTALSGGRFLVAWVSELQRSGPVDNSNPNFAYPILSLPSVDIYARVFNYNDGVTNAPSEFQVNTANDACANPTVAATSDGSFLIAWSQKDSNSPRNNSWDVFGRSYSSLGIGGATRCINSYLYGDQFAPQASASGTNFVVVWTSMGQDGNWEGVYGQVIANTGSPVGSEFLVNTTTVSRQFQPAIASDGRGRLLTVWSGLSGNRNFNLYGQQFVAPDYIPDPSATNAYAAPYADPFLNNSTPTQPPKLDPPIVILPGSGTNLISFGTYAGLFYDTNGISAASAGAFSAVVGSSSGTFSARLSMAGKSWSASGRFNGAGNGVVRIPRGNLRTLTVTLHQGNGQIQGQVSDGVWTSDVLAYQNAFSRKNPAPQAGTFMLDVPGAAVSAASPGGDSYGPITVDLLGNVQWAGSLADGTKFTQKSAVSSQALWPVYVPLYGGQGCIIGWGQITNSSVSGQLVWIKPSGLPGLYYPAGFTNEINVAGVPRANAKLASAAVKLGGGTRNLVLAGGGLAAPIIVPIRIETNGRVTNLSTNKITLSLNTSAGLFRGSVVDPHSQKPVQIQGALFNDWDVGLGYFLNPSQSGQALITPVQ